MKRINCTFTLMSLFKIVYHEDQIIQRIKEGGRARQEAEYVLYDRFQYLVRQGMKKRGLTEDQAIDAYTDAFMALVDKVAKGDFRQENKLSTLLHQIFFNKCVDVFRKNANKQEMTELLPEIPNMPDRAQDIVKRIAISQDMDKLKAFMSHLGKTCQEVLWSSLYDGFRPAEIAEQLGMKNAETVLSQKSRCLKQLRKLISESSGVFDTFRTD
ncbi:MAG: RNA polymerase sigma factor [Bacteroidia bacterium]